MAKKKTNETITIVPVDTEEVAFCIVGTSGLLHNRLPEKARHQLLLPQGSRRDSGKLKHDVEKEYFSSIYRSTNPDDATFVQMLGAAFRNAMQTAALELPGVTKAQVARLIWVVEDRISIFGLPQLHMGIVRQAGINKTPDVRTRAYMPKWAAVVPVRFVTPQFATDGVANLLAAAGTFVGVGDGRNEKGALSHGLWRICSEQDPDFVQICKEGGREAQERRMTIDLDAVLAGESEVALCNTDETQDLYAWYCEARKNWKSLTPRKGKKSKSNGATATA